MENESAFCAFSQQVIWNALGKYLTLQDFQNLRLANYLLCDQVNDCPYFQEKIWKSIWIKVDQPDECFLQHDINLKSKNIKVVFVGNPFLISNQPSFKTSDFLNETIHSVKLTQFDARYAKTLDFVKYLRDPDLLLRAFELLQNTAGGERERRIILTQDTLKIILSRLNNVKSLQLSGVMLCDAFKDVEFLDDNLWTGLTKLHELTIYKSSKSSQWLLHRSLKKILQLILDSVKTDKLRKLSLTGFSKVDSLQTNIFATLKNSVQRLQTIELLQHDFWNNSLENISFPSLKCLKLVSKYDSKDKIEIFLDSQPLLTSLHMEWIDYLPKCVFDVISRKSSLLRKIYIKAKSFGPHENSGDWQFLSDLQFLEDFQLISGSNGMRHLTTYNTMLAQLPKAKLSRLYIEGLADGWGIRPLETEQLFQFKSLTQLGILNCNAAITNEVFREICSNAEFQKNLKALEISNCLALPQLGFLGSPYGLLLNNLSALETLRVTSCRNITDDDLSVLSLPNLKHLDVSGASRVSRIGVSKVAINNSKLETLSNSCLTQEARIQELHLLNSRRLSNPRGYGWRNPNFRQRSYQTTYYDYMDQRDDYEGGSDSD